MNIIAAVDKHWAIGNRGKLLVTIPDDQKLFREETKGKVIVMGRKTLESLPGGQPLAGRVNVVLTRDESYRAKGCEIFHDLSSAMEYLKQFASENIYIIGGAEIYRAFLRHGPHHMDRLRVHGGYMVPGSRQRSGLGSDGGQR